MCTWLRFYDISASSRLRDTQLSEKKIIVYLKQYPYIRYEEGLPS